MTIYPKIFYEKDDGKSSHCLYLYSYALKRNLILRKYFSGIQKNMHIEYSQLNMWRYPELLKKHIYEDYLFCMWDFTYQMSLTGFNLLDLYLDCDEVKIF